MEPTADNVSILHSRRVPVSVVIPCYRCRDTIERAVSSVAAQSALPERVILVDDRSEDNTLEKLKQLQARYPAGWIDIIAKPTNGGPGESRNIGWDAATTPYIAFLDADDSWHPLKLELQYSLMAGDPALALTGHGNRYLEDADQCQSVVHEPLPEQLQMECVRSVSARGLLLSNKFSTTSVVMLRRDLPLRFEAGKKYCEDYLLWMQIVFAGHRACILELPLAYAYKAAYGDGGLTQRIWRMEMGELDAYRKVFHRYQVGVALALPIYLFSLAKCIRRYLIRSMRGLRRSLATMKHHVWDTK
ncbi:glycosyltransferase family 2 protein [[Pseudomonas] boreopolis]|uniref:glycosyltransferase family 2 protein n=1 Tax=Xanthomonas boreopolis TaxID=86183 RepID=UPI003DA0177C